MATILQCTVTDVKTIVEIGKQTFYETFYHNNDMEQLQLYLETAFTVEKLEEELCNTHSTFYIVTIDDAIAGYLKLNIADAQTEDMGNDALEIERIYVLQAYQKHGLGKLLFERAVEQASALDKKRIWLGVWEHNENAIGFYKKQGFVQTASHVFKMGDEEQIDFVMEKLL